MILQRERILSLANQEFQKLLNEKEIGKIRLVEANCSKWNQFYLPYNHFVRTWFLFLDSKEIHKRNTFLPSSCTNFFILYFYFISQQSEICFLEIIRRKRNNVVRINKNKQKWIDSRRRQQIYDGVWKREIKLSNSDCVFKEFLLVLSLKTNIWMISFLGFK